LPTFGPEIASCEVLVFREGLLSAVGHDLLLRATAFEIAIDLERPAISVLVEASSLRVVSAMRDGRPLPGALGPADVRDIEATTAAKVLRAPRFPRIRFESAAVSRLGAGYQVQGSLALAGVTRPMAFPVRREGARLTAAVTVHQPDFGIRPYRTMMGALRVRPDVLVRASVPGEGL
jgi:polyisoprenoid-binding protein YceI